jgi:hypothetical protein
MTTERRKQQVLASKRRERAAKRDLAAAIADEDVQFGDDGLPVVVDAARKAQCRDSLESFALTYLPDVFNLAMSPGQRADLATMQTAIVRGGRYAFAAPRGDGKTSRVEAAILWAALYGHRKCIVIVGSDLGAAQEIEESIKLELRINDNLREDFPVPCWAATLSDDTALKAKQWTWRGQSLHIAWAKGRTSLPVLDGADGSGCVIVPRGLTGRLRGMRVKVNKRAVRPDFFAIDDPQTDESASSRAQVDTRENLILGAIMGSGGPAKTVSAIMPCTIIKHDDLAARFLDRKRHPDWQGATRGMVRVWPTAQKTRWAEYMRLRREESADEATAYYLAHRAEMDAGAEVDWAERFAPGKEISALQHAENLLCDLGEEVFMAEYQNNPKEANPSIYDLTPDIVASRVHIGRSRGVVPPEARIVVAATDINHYGLHTVVAAFANDQTGYVLHYQRYDCGGAGIVPLSCPEQEARRRIYEALVAHGSELSALRFVAGQNRAPIALWLIDAGYKPDVVRQFLEKQGCSIGIPIMAARGFNADKYRPNTKGIIGRPREQCHFTESAIVGRFLALNTDYWREVSQKAWLGSVGAPGSISLFEGARHREFAEQICREKLIEKLKGSYGFVWRWHTAPGWHDYADSLTMAYAAAAWKGIGTGGMLVRRAGPPKERRKPKVKMEF